MVKLKERQISLNESGRGDQCGILYNIHDCQSYLRQLRYLTFYTLTPMVIVPNLGRSQRCLRWDCCHVVSLLLRCIVCRDRMAVPLSSIYIDNITYFCYSDQGF